MKKQYLCRAVPAINQSCFPQGLNSQHLTPSPIPTKNLTAAANDNINLETNYFATTSSCPDLILSPA